MNELGVSSSGFAEFTVTSPETERTFTVNLVYRFMDNTGFSGAENIREDTVGPITIKVQATNPCEKLDYQI